MTAVYASLRESSQRAVIEPFVDFGALDLVGVVVPSGHHERPGRHRGRREPASEASVRVLVAGGLVVRRRWSSRSRVFPHLAWEGIVPNLCLLVVVAAALVRGPAFAAVARLLRRAARSTSRRRPTTSPAAGRWPWSSSGTSPGRCARTPGPTATTVVATVAASSFIGTSVYALTGLVLGDAGRRRPASCSR